MIKTLTVILSDSANCTVLRAVVLAQYRRVTERRTDGQTDERTDEHCGALEKPKPGPTQCHIILGPYTF